VTHLRRIMLEELERRNYAPESAIGKTNAVLGPLSGSHPLTAVTTLLKEILSHTSIPVSPCLLLH
jgi:hypothetical protein